jgi:hypothetical protein
MRHKKFRKEASILWQVPTFFFLEIVYKMSMTRNAGF